MSDPITKTAQKNYRAVVVGCPMRGTVDRVEARMQIYGASLDVISEWADKILASGSAHEHPNLRVEIYEQKEVLVETRKPEVKEKEPK